MSQTSQNMKNAPAEAAPQAETPAPNPMDRAAIEAIANPHDRLRVIMQRLLDPGGCPWDREQTHETLRQYFIEEVYEACEAIDEKDDASLREELGDVALQIVFHAELAERRGAFRLEDVYAGVCKKLLDRHPHVFGDVQADDAEQVLQNWEQIKKKERQKKAAAAPGKKAKTSVLSGVPRPLPALQRAERLQEKAARVGFDWERPADVAAKVREEVEEFIAEAEARFGAQGGPAGSQAAMQEEFGDLLFSLVNLSRFIGIHSEETLDAACAKFTRRFMEIEKAAEAGGRNLKDMTLAEMDALWNEAKLKLAK